MEVVVRYLNAVSARCVLDIGANAGLYSLSLERMSGGTEREYFLFEPLAPTYEKLKKTLMINEADMTRFHLINCGMSDKKESTYFYLSGASEAAPLMPMEDEFYLKKIRVDGSYTGGDVMTKELCQVTTVDSFIDENHIEGVDFIKIEVEGNEKFVLYGANDTLERFHPFCYCELLRKHSRRFGYHPNEVISYMKELGYNTFTLHEGRLSITRHEITSYWWSDGRGMEATSQNTDYVHQTESLLADKLEELKPGAKGINGYAFNYFVWETNAHDRAQTYPVMDKYMTEGGGLDVVVLQLGENVLDASADGSTYESDYTELIQHIKEEAPNAQIITVGDFWADDTNDAVKRSAAEETGVTYVDLAEIQDDTNYEAGMGTMVEGDDGEEHEIEHSGVAKYPGDTGMKWIAKKIVEAIEK